MGSFINHVDRAGGGGVSEKTMFVHMGGGRGPRLVHVDKNVHFGHMNSNAL